MKVFRQFWLHWTVAGNVNYADQIKRNIKIGIAVHCHCLCPGQIILLCWKVLAGSDGTRHEDEGCDVIARILLETVV